MKTKQTEKQILCGYLIRRYERCKRPVKAPRWQCGIKNHPAKRGCYQSQAGNVFTHEELAVAAVFGRDDRYTDDINELSQIPPEVAFAKDSFLQMMDLWGESDGQLIVDNGLTGVNTELLDSFLDMMGELPEGRSTYIEDARESLTASAAEFEACYRDYSPTSNVPPWSEMSEPPDNYVDAQGNLEYDWDYAVSLMALEYADTVSSLGLIRREADGSMRIVCHDSACNCSLQDYDCVLHVLTLEERSASSSWGKIDKSAAAVP